MLSADVISELEDRFGGVWFAGDETNVICPFCTHRGYSADRSGHLAINFPKNVAHCVRCDWGCRNVRDWLSKRGMTMLGEEIGNLDSLSKRLSDAKRMLEGERTPVYLQKQKLDLPEGFSFFEEGDQELSFLGHYINSLRKKHLRMAEIIEEKLGYCYKGRLTGYVIFPFVEEGDLVYWQGRAALPSLLADKKKRKYNPSKDVAPMGKNHWFYGFDHAVQDGFAILCEGPLDQISLNRFAKKNYGDHAYALSVQGHTISFPAPGRHPLNSQIGKLFSLKPQRICVLYDADVREKSQALVELLQLAGFNAFAGNLPEGKDPNDFHRDAETLTEATTQLDPVATLRARLRSM